MLQRFTRLAFVPTAPALGSFPIQELAPAHFAWASAEARICTPAITNVLPQVALAGATCLGTGPFSGLSGTHPAVRRSHVDMVFRA